MTDIALQVENQLWTGWKTVRITRSLETCAGTFELGVTQLAGELVLRPGQRCIVLRGAAPVVTGYLDEVSRSYSRQDSNIQVRGRDATADLVDCSSTLKNGRWRKRRLDQIAADLLQPFSIRVVSNGTMPTLERFAVEPGETVWESLERMSRHTGTLIRTTGDGTLLLEQRNTQTPTWSLPMEAVIRAELLLSERERFSAITLLGQEKGSDALWGAPVAAQAATSTDPEIKRYRPLQMHSAGGVGRKGLAARARWEVNVRRARGASLSYTLFGWGPTDATVWAPGDVLQVNDPMFGLAEARVLSSVSLMLDEGGTRSELTLLPPDAFVEEAS